MLFIHYGRTRKGLCLLMVRFTLYVKTGEEDLFICYMLYVICYKRE